jgi:signal transduction histidine kinase
MRRSYRPSPVVWAAGLTMIGLLVILAVLQYRWLGELSSAEKLHMRDRMQSSATRFAREFDRELTRALILLDPGSPRRPRETYADRRARWASSALAPRIVRDVFVASLSRGDLALARVDEATGELSPLPWPAELLGLKDRLRTARPAPEPGPSPRPRRELALPAADVPALVAPAAGERPPASGYTIIWLDRSVIEKTLLPELASRYFGGSDGLEYAIELSPIADPSRVIFHAGPRVAGAGARSDAEVGLFALLRLDEIEPADQPAAQAASGESRARTPAPPRPAGPSEWRLRVTHASGSLEAAVASVRRRNLAISFSTLLLLALAMAMLLLTTRRAQSLARQQLEFTAGVTHELATPLAGMRSAAQNLADGVVADPGQVREYGRLIEREGRRLTEMVDQVLSFAGLESGKTALERRPVAIRDVIEDALASSRRALDEKGFRVVTDVPDDLPDVSGDRSALRRAVENLVGNVVKYAADGRWLGIRASVEAGPYGAWMAVAVADHGPGVNPEDLPHVFEPFYRGRGRAASAVPGSGLGLTVVSNIVQAHGGRIEIDTGADRGTTFTLALPLATDAGAGL